MATQPDVSSDKLRFAGDVNVGEVKITSLVSNKTFNVANQLITIQIFEDIFSPFITGSIIVRESFDLINLFPFAGEEKLELDISTPTLEKGNIKSDFYIYKLTDSSVSSYNDKRYFDKFRKKMISNLRLNNKLSKPVKKQNKILIIIKRLFLPIFEAIQRDSHPTSVLQVRKSQAIL